MFFVNFRWISTFSSKGKSQVGVKQGVNIGILIEFFSFFSIRFDHDTWHICSKTYWVKLPCMIMCALKNPIMWQSFFKINCAYCIIHMAFFDKLQIKKFHDIQCFYYPASLFLSVKDLNFKRKLHIDQEVSRIFYWLLNQLINLIDIWHKLTLKNKNFAIFGTYLIW